MADSQEKPWANNPNAPKFTYFQYYLEKNDLTGLFIASILYGVPNTPPSTRPSIGAH